MSASGEGTLQPSRLVGTWRLTRWLAADEDGRTSMPFGDEPVGYVVYTADGRMITTISRSGRTSIGGDLFSAPEAACADAFNSFLAYSGEFRVDGGDVVHRVEMSLYPDWVGTEQRRHVELSQAGDRLTLSTDPVYSSGRMLRHRLTWERATD